MGHVSPTPPLCGLFVIRMLGLVTINVCAKFEFCNLYPLRQDERQCQIYKIQQIAHGKAYNREMIFKDTQGHR